MIMAAQFFDADANGVRLFEPGEQVAASPKPGPLASAVALSRSALQGMTALARRPATSVQLSTAYAASAYRLLVPTKVPLSPVLQDHSGVTTIATIRLQLDHLKAAGKAFDASVNDMFLAGLSRGLHAYHLAVAGESVPEVRVAMAINSRPAGDDTAGGNSFVPVRLHLPLLDAELGVLVKHARRAAGLAKSEPAIGIAPHISRALGLSPEALAVTACSGMYHGVDFSSSNFPGPPFPLWCAGSQVLELYAVGPRAGGAFGVTLISYDGEAHISFNIDSGAVGFPELLEDCMRSAFEEILAVSKEGGVTHLNGASAV
jgi:hypothetical protein